MDKQYLRQCIYTALDKREFALARQYMNRLKLEEPAEAQGLLVSSYLEEGNLVSGAEALTELRSTAPNEPYTQYLAARLAYEEGSYSQAMVLLQNLLEGEDGEGLAPEVSERAWNLLGRCAHVMGEPQTAMRAYLAASQQKVDPLMAANEYSNYLFNRHYLMVTDTALERQAAEGYQKFFSLDTALLHRFRKSVDADGKPRKLRIGYLSPDFRRHVMFSFIWNLLTVYDKERFEVYAYAGCPEDEYSCKLQARVDKWLNVQGWEPGVIARQIYADKVDILMDLAGHTTGGLLPVLAFRPAPVQITGLGYWSTTGLTQVDYFLGDVYLDGEQGEAQPQFVEELLILPHSHFCWRPVRQIPCRSYPPGRDKGYITFGSFNDFAKANRSVLGAWREIMMALPDSRLILKCALFNTKDGVEQARSKLVGAGFDMGRVELRPATREYLQEYYEVDIALDTFPYTGGGTTCDALYMGVPVVTLVGRTHGSRFGYSILANAGLRELCAFSIEEYVRLAVHLAEDGELLTALHSNLRQMLKNSPVMDAGLYSKSLAEAYTGAWEKYEAGVRRIPDLAERRQLLREMRSLGESGDMEQAMACADRLSLAQLDRHTTEEVLIRYIDGKDVQCAQQMADRLLKFGRRSYALVLAAHVAYLSNEPEKARSLLKEAWQLGGLTDGQQGIAHHLAGNVAMDLGEVALATRESLIASRIRKNSQEAQVDYSNYLFRLHFSADKREEQYEAALGYSKMFSKVERYEHKPVRRHKKIRVGYISPDFCEHVVACFAKAFFYSYDRSRFEVYGYSTSPENWVSRSFARQADVWRCLSGESVEEQARLIKEDEIDILFDLSGHSANSCLPVLARKPAPIQLSGIGFFATTGLAEVDYFVADKHTALQGEEDYFTEKLLRLPHSHFCYCPMDLGYSLPVAPAPCRKNGYITFGSFNQVGKLNQEVLRLWARLMKAVPASRLFLKNTAFDSEQGRNIILKRLDSVGIDLSKVKIEGHSEDYQRSYYEVDIALDTFPYPGGGTTCDALYMGVPVVTLSGSTHHERFGDSFMMNLGEEIASLCLSHSEEDYLQKAVDLASDEERLSKLHLSLRRRVQASPVMDAWLYMGDMEHAYTDIFLHWLREDDKAYAKELQRSAHCKRKAEQENDSEAVVREAALLSQSTQNADERAEEAYAVLAAKYRLSDYSSMRGWQEEAAKSEFGYAAYYAAAKAAAERGHFTKGLAYAAQGLKNFPDMPAEYRVGLLAEKAKEEARLDCENMSDSYRAAYLAEEDAFKRCAFYSSWLLTFNRRDIDEAELFRMHIGFRDCWRNKNVAAYTYEASALKKRFVQRGKLRIGYLSPDFRRHVMLNFLRPLLTLYDKDSFEVYAYSLTDRPDAETDWLKTQVDVWRDVQGMDFARLAEQIHRDEVDIIVDLAGHSAGNALPALAYKPAPLAVSGLGYTATTGLKEVDYFLTDAVVDPPGVQGEQAGGHQQYFTERLCYLPYQFCYQRADALPASAGAPCLERSWLLFGVFNMYWKYTDEMLAAWREILVRIPGAKLLLKCQPFIDACCVEQAFARLVRLGFDMDRVIFEPATSDYMQRYLDVDIALDTYPYPGGGTTCDALYMGVPVVTRYASRRSTRFGLDMLAAAGLSDLACSTMEEYVAKAVALANDKAFLHELHKQLRPLLSASPLMDGQGYVHEAESAYQRIWQRFSEDEEY